MLSHTQDCRKARFKPFLQITALKSIVHFDCTEKSNKTVNQVSEIEDVVQRKIAERSGVTQHHTHTHQQQSGASEVDPLRNYKHRDHFSDHHNCD